MSPGDFSTLNSERMPMPWINKVLFKDLPWKGNNSMLRCVTTCCLWFRETVLLKIKWSASGGILLTLSMSETRLWNENSLKRSWKQNLLCALLVRVQGPHATLLQTQSSRAMPQSPRTTLDLQTWTVWLVLLRSSLLRRIWGLSLSPNPGFYTFPKIFILFQ